MGIDYPNGQSKVPSVDSELPSLDAEMLTRSKSGHPEAFSDGKVLTFLAPSIHNGQIIYEMREIPIIQGTNPVQDEKVSEKPSLEACANTWNFSTECAREPIPRDDNHIPLVG